MVLLGQAAFLQSSRVPDADPRRPRADVCLTVEAGIVNAWLELLKGGAVIWKKPTIVEIALGAEINSYALASRT